MEALICNRLTRFFTAWSAKCDYSYRAETQCRGLMIMHEGQVRQRNRGVEEM